MIGCKTSLGLSDLSTSCLAVPPQATMPHRRLTFSYSWGDGRSYNVGLSGRGQKALRDLDVMDEVCLSLLNAITSKRFPER